MRRLETWRRRRPRVGARAGWSAEEVCPPIKVSCDFVLAGPTNLGKSSVAHNTVLGSNRVEPTDGVIILVFPSQYNHLFNLGSSTLESPNLSKRLCGPMDKARVYGTRDSRFDPWHSQKLLFFYALTRSNYASWSQLHPREVSRHSVECGGVGALAKRRHAMLPKTFLATTSALILVR